jgi:acyl phosphate:glycerol-3-phosphate acyltransferase
VTTVSVAWGLLAVAVGYLLGAINPAALFARRSGADLRGTGSGNPGATNATRVMGWRIGVTVGVFDVLKGFVPALAFGTVSSSAGALAGLAAVVGHITSPFLKGHGGKGVATALGAILGTHAIWAVPVLAVFGLVVAVTRRMGLGAVAGALMLVPASVVWWDGWSGVAFAVALTGIVVVRHRRNLADAWRGRHPQR